jgi:hypothetical protein
MNKFVPTVFIGVIIVFGIWFFYSNDKDEIKINEQLEGDKKEEDSQTLDGDKKYINTDRGFSLVYPKDLNFEEVKEGGTRRTLVFSDKAEEKSFQIYFTPYDLEYITQSKILEDVSSGRFTQPTEVVINGKIKALVFFSTTNFGEMREIWFIHKGYLYEITTFKELDLWLSEILKTWEFL